MLPYLLDTDHISLLARNGPNSLIVRRILEAPEGTVVASIISFEEQTRGWLAHIASIRSVQLQPSGYQRLEDALRFYSNIPLLPFDAQAVEQFQTLWLQRIRISTSDLKIASIALSRGATVLTRNSRHFSKVPGLTIEDWTV